MTPTHRRLPNGLLDLVQKLELLLGVIELSFNQLTLDNA